MVSQAPGTPLGSSAAASAGRALCGAGSAALPMRGLAGGRRGVLEALQSEQEGGEAEGKAERGRGHALARPKPRRMQ